MTQQELRQELIQRFPRERSQLLPALHYIHHEFGYLPEWALQVIGWHLHIPSSEVYGAATSYTELRIEAPGEHVIRVCTGLSCWLKGSEEVMVTLQAGLEGNLSDTGTGSHVTLEETPCGFLCALGPAIQIDGGWRGRVGPSQAAQIAKDFRLQT